ncbi:MAG: hypothetical protein Q7I93_04305 [Syntrophales bacterium]|nr:hypothetical protein [Syntrophales bacterium]
MRLAAKEEGNNAHARKSCFRFAKRNGHYVTFPQTAQKETTDRANTAQRLLPKKENGG